MYSLRAISSPRQYCCWSGSDGERHHRGLHYTVGTKGSRVTVGLPGTGLFWTKKISPGFRPAQHPRNQQQTNLPPGPGAQARQLRQPQAYSPLLGAGNPPISGMQPGRQAYQPQTNRLALGGGNQGFQSPPIQGVHAPQIQGRFTAGLLPSHAPSTTHTHVFLPSWLVWSVLTVIVIAGLCFGAAMLAAILR